MHRDVGIYTSRLVAGRARRFRNRPPLAGLSPDGVVLQELHEGTQAVADSAIRISHELWPLATMTPLLHPVIANTQDLGCLPSSEHGVDGDWSRLHRYHRWCSRVRMRDGLAVADRIVRRAHRPGRKVVGLTCAAGLQNGILQDMK